MRNEQRVIAGPVAGFRLSSDAYVMLGLTRDQQRLLGDLTVPVGEGPDDRITLSAEALVDCFVRIAEELEAVIEGAEPVPA